MAKALPSAPRNPFEFGRELGANELVDREAELEAISASSAIEEALFHRAAAFWEDLDPQCH